MIKIAVCDDEEYFREQIKEFLVEYMENMAVPFEIDVFSSGKKLADIGTKLLGYKIIFLDINMNDIDGIETAKIVRKYNQDSYLVFVTAYMDYTLEGYKVEAFRYILKKEDYFKEPLEECMNAIFEKMHYAVAKIKFKFNEGEHEIFLARLIYVESRLHKLEFHVMEEKEKIFSLYGKLNEIDKLLEKQSFIRIHQSFLINMKYIRRIERYKVILDNNLEFAISRARYNFVKDSYITFRGEM